MLQVVILRTLTSEARIPSEFIPWKFCGEQIRNGTSFSRVLLFTLLLHFTSCAIFVYSYIIGALSSS
jgi:hypothetical protein